MSSGLLTNELGASLIKNSALKEIVGSAVEEMFNLILGSIHEEQQKPNVNFYPNTTISPME